MSHVYTNRIILHIKDVEDLNCAGNANNPCSQFVHTVNILRDTMAFSVNTTQLCLILYRGEYEENYMCYFFLLDLRLTHCTHGQFETIAPRQQNAKAFAPSDTEIDIQFV